MNNSKRPAAVRGVVFDWAGTMIDHGSCAPASVFVETFRRQQVPITIAQARAPMGMAKRDHLRAITEMPEVRQAWAVRFGTPPSEADLARIYDEFLPLQQETLADHCGLIPGVAETVAWCRQRGLKIAGTTGYTRVLMEIVEPLAAKQGYRPDVSLCSDDVPAGRPAPWLLFLAAQRMNVYPMYSIVKVDDTEIGIEAGQNAGAWTVAVTRTGNELGLSQRELASLDLGQLARKLSAAQEKFLGLGADFVVESVADLPPVIDEIDRRMREGMRPGQLGRASD